MRKYIANNPTFPEGVYSTVADQELLAKLPVLEEIDESNLEEKPARNDLGRAIRGMFRNLSVPVDPNCDKHKNGKLNILYGSFNLEEDNIYTKGTDQESQLARIQKNWDKPESRTNVMYFGTSVNVK